MQRARGEAQASFRLAGGVTRLATLRQAGALKLRFPRVSSGPAEAVLVNTAGGLAGGDRLSLTLEVGDSAGVRTTTQACERVYRSLGDDALVEARLQVGRAASLAHLPQETILFEGARLRRRLEADVAEDGRLLLCESVVLGREAMGERVTAGRLRESWRIRRGGALVFAEELDLSGALSGRVRAKAGLGGGRAFATLVLVDRDAGRRLQRLRDVLGPDGGASDLGGLLVARLVAASMIDLRARLVPALGLLADGELSRLWSL